uniref:Uncharacterized protein n=1 Tax=Leersia perrieri TaxID=77586 RepID=A0A0D9XP96_9ORYZ
MAGGSSSTPPPSVIYPYHCFSGHFPAPVDIYNLNGVVIKAYGMGARGELLVTASGGPPGNGAAWTTVVAEPGQWFYGTWSEQSGGYIMINSAEVAGVTNGIVAQSSNTGTGVYLPEPRVHTVQKVQQPTSLVPKTAKRDMKAPTKAGGKHRNPIPKTSTTDADNGKEIQMSYAAAVKGGPSNAARIMETADPSHATVKAGQSQMGQRFQRRNKAAMAATVTVKTPVPEKEKEKDQATTPMVNDIPELALLPEEWVY